MTEIPNLTDKDRAELAADIERNRQARLDYIDFKVRWMREHGQIIDPEPGKGTGAKS